MTAVYVEFGDEPGQWDRRLPKNALCFVLIAPLFFLAALTGMAHPGAAFSFAVNPVLAVISILTVVLVIGVQLWGVLLLRRRRALGVIVSVVGAVYVTPMVQVLAIAVVILQSVWVTVATAVLVAYSLYCLVRTEAQRTPGLVSRVAQERFLPGEFGLCLIQADAMDDGGLVTQAQAKDEGAGTWICGLLVLVAMIGLPVIAVVFFGMSSRYIAPLFIWVMCVGIFTLARWSVSSFVLLWRAMGDALRLSSATDNTGQMTRSEN